jgi:hypothetical protein
VLWVPWVHDKILLARPKLEWTTHLADRGCVGDQPQQRASQKIYRMA